MRAFAAAVMMTGWLGIGGAALACGGSGGGGGGTTATSTGGATLLTGEGSQYYDMMVEQAMQQQRALAAMQRAAERAAKLAQRRVWAENRRAEIAQERRYHREKLTGHAAPETAPATLQTAAHTGYRF